MQWSIRTTADQNVAAGPKSHGRLLNCGHIKAVAGPKTAVDLKASVNQNRGRPERRSQLEYSGRPEELAVIC